MDILKQLYECQIDDDMADDLLEELIRDAKNQGYKETESFLKHVGFNEYEFTAYGQGLPVEVLAKWRYEGWPTTYLGTQTKFDYRNYGWFVKNVGDTYGLVKISDLV